jgi:hypothetical protein
MLKIPDISTNLKIGPDGNFGPEKKTDLEERRFMVAPVLVVMYGDGC